MQVDDDVDDSGRPRLDYHKRKAVDESFTRLFGYDWGTEFELDEESMESPDIRELVKIFGPTRAARILGSPAPEGFYARKKRRMAASQQQRQKQVGGSGDPIVIPMMAKPEMVTETKVFAGQAIQVQTKKTDTVQGNSKKKGTAASSNLDNVLAQLSGPTKISTATKTHNDWEQFKSTDKQLQEDLERKAQSKDAFLVKQDFLNRVDNRQFEIEKDKRDRERARRGK